MWIATAERSREIDRRAREEFNISSQRLMEAAGTAVFQSLPPAKRVVVFCGQGNNGGDGFVVAALAARSGKEVLCLVAAREDQLSPDAKRQCDDARRAKVRPIFVDSPNWSEELQNLDGYDVIVDALLGTGSRGPLAEAYLQAVLAMNESDVPVISVDIPTGIDCDTGATSGEAVWAQSTISFGLPKRCFFTGEGPDHAGSLRIADIGFPASILTEPTDAFLVDNAWVADRLPHRWHTSHKGTSGHVLIVAGSARYRGAATLACLGALRAGAGLVTLAAIESVCAAVAAQLPEVIFQPLLEREGAISGSPDIDNADSIVFGPGISLGARDSLAAMWRDLSKPSVIDADALNLVAAGLELPPGPCVLTPHPGEMARLTGRDVKDILANRFDAVRSFSSKTVVLKGANSLVSEQGMPAIGVCPAGNPGMATAGMGDVLSGVIGTLLAQGMETYDAAACGAALHAMAGDVCAETIGPIGYSPKDLALALPQARAKITSA